MSRQFRSDDTNRWIYGFGNGTDGDLTISSNTTESPIDSSCSGTSGTTSLSATGSFVAGQFILIHQTRGTGAGGWELNRVESYNAGTITTSHPLAMTYTDSVASQAQVRVMKQYNNVTVDSTKTYTGKSWNGNVGGIIGWFAKGTTTINGSCVLSGGNATSNTPSSTGGFLGSAGDLADNDTSKCGEGTSGSSTDQNTANGNGGGGNIKVVGSASAGGGGGGNGTAGGSGTNVSSSTGGVGGSAVGTASLTNMNLGGAGGSTSAPGSPDFPSAGGSGGGICLIITNNFTISGNIAVNGGNGGTPTNGGGAGGGAGGSILLKCRTATLGTNLLTATAGTKGSGAGAGGNGGDGGVGRIHIDYSVSYSGTTTPTIDATNDPTIIENNGGSFIFNML